MVDPLQSNERLSLELFARQAGSFETFHQIQSAVLGRPFELEFWKRGGKLTEVRPIGALVRIRVCAYLQTASGSGGNCDSRQIDDLAIEELGAIVEGLVVH